MKKLLWVAVATLAATYFLVGRTADRGPAIVFDRLWIDHLPRSESDVFRFFVVFTEDPRGVFNQQTFWKGEWEAFRYEARRDGELDVEYPADKTRARVRYHAWRCDEGEFTFCLDLSGGKGAKKYYSKKEWEIGSVEAARTFVEKLPR